MLFGLAEENRHRVLLSAVAFSKGPLHMPAYNKGQCDPRWVWEHVLVKPDPGHELKYQGTSMTMIL